MPIRFTYKGSILMFIGLFLINIFIVPLFYSFGNSNKFAIVIVNSILSSFFINLIITFVDGKFVDWISFTKRYALLIVFFAFITFFGA